MRTTTRVNIEGAVKILSNDIENFLVAFLAIVIILLVFGLGQLMRIEAHVREIKNRQAKGESKTPKVEGA